MQLRAIIKHMFFYRLFHYFSTQRVFSTLISLCCWIDDDDGRVRTGARLQSGRISSKNETVSRREDLQAQGEFIRIMRIMRIIHIIHIIIRNSCQHLIAVVEQTVSRACPLLFSHCFWLRIMSLNHHLSIVVRRLSFIVHRRPGKCCDVDVSNLFPKSWWLDVLTATCG